MAGEAREKCAVGGILVGNDQDYASMMVRNSLFAMQHRGAEASGIVSITPSGSLEAHRELGLVRDIYSETDIARLSGSIAVGHNRYSTSGDKMSHLQPTREKSTGSILATNGNIPDTEKLETYLEKHNMLHGRPNDTEMMGLALSQSLREKNDLPTAVEQSYHLFAGAFSCVAAQDNVLVAFRDPYGIRPLALGRCRDNWVVASETSGLDIIGAEYEREVQPGELIIITKDGLETKQLAEGQHKLDIFEFVYFSRHDSFLYGQSVNEARYRFGQRLAIEHGALHDDGSDVVVIPVPDTSIPEAEGYAASLGLQHRQLIIKNRYIGRTFMQPDQLTRQEQVALKHNPVKGSVKDKHVVLIDDSIVRLNTIPRLVKQLEAEQAKSVSVLIGSPPVRFPDYYGIDTPKQAELAAANMTVEQMREKIGCRYLGFLSLAGMIEATGMPADMFNLSCFTGEYPIDIGKRKREISTPVSMEYVA
jgi:amidophosphoribosyltransferase